jgi:aminoacyl tRNA synthase complex-interacting multifunctional protein 1
MSTARLLLDALISEIEFSLSAADESAASPPEVKVPKHKQEKAVPAASSNDEINVNSLDLRVGQIVSVKKHETADKLYCEMIDVGEGEPRAIASGLVPHYTIEEMQGRRLIVVCNLKPRSLVGFKSNGMVLCAAKVVDGAEVVEFVDPPASAAIGERIVGEGLTNAAVSASQCDKKKVFEVVSGDLRVDQNGVAHWKHIRLLTANGLLALTAPTLRDAIVR